MTNEPESPAAAANMMDPGFLANPYPVMNALREHETGVARDALGVQWYVTRHDDVDRLLHDRAFSVDPRKADPGTSSSMILEMLTGDDHQLSMLLLDAPDHTRLRSLVNKAFTPRSVEVLRPVAESIARTLLDEAGGQPRFDLMEVFAQPFPAMVIAELIGVDPAYQARFKQWSDAIVHQLDPFASSGMRDEAENGLAAMDAYFREVIAARRAQPRDDLVTRLITASDDGVRLSEEEIVTMLVLLLAAGNVTTTDLIGNGTLALLQNPGELEELRAQPALMANAVEEMLRYDPPVIETGRIPLAEVEFGGCPIAARQTIAPSLAAANHDPRAYPEPGVFDISRADTHHHSFGGGAHYCLGAPLARMEAHVAFTLLLERFPNLRLDPEAGGPEYRLMPGFRGLKTLPVRVD